MSTYAHERQNGYIHADLDTFFNVWTSHALRRKLASRMDIVCDSDAGSHERVILDHSELCNVAIAVDFDIVADLAAVVDCCRIPDVKSIAYRIFFSDNDVVASGKAIADNRATVDNCARTNTSIVTDAKCVVGYFSSGAVAKNRAAVDTYTFTKDYVRKN